MNTPEPKSPATALADTFGALRAGIISDDDPFCFPVSKAGLYASAGRHYLRIFSDLVLGRRIHRDAHFVSNTYERIWGRNNATNATSMQKRHVPLWVGGHLALVSGWFLYWRCTRAILDAAANLGAKSILEVGSGRGLNLALMALRRPDLTYTGVELTSNGIEASRALVNDLPPQCLEVAGVATLNEERRAALKRIEFQQGNAMQMPFPDKHFDVSFTNLVLEQIPHDFGKALDEMRRVTRHYCIFNEAFAEANDWLGKAYLRRIDYFRFSKEEWRKHGLEPVAFTTEMPQKLTFRTGLLVARVID